MWQVRLVWACLAVAWLIAEWRLHASSRQGAAPLEYTTRDRLWVAVTLGFMLALACKFALLAPLPFDYLPRQAVAAVLVASGLALRYYAIRILGGFFSTDIALHPAHRLITTGPYRHLCHPAYSGLLLALSGAALALGDAVGGLAWIGLSTAALKHRIELEEQALEQAFGETYREYCRARWRLLPGVY